MDGLISTARAIRGPHLAGQLAGALRGHAGLPEHVLVAGSSELLVDSAQALPRMLEDIAGARSSIEVAEYVLTPSGDGRRILEALRARARDSGRPPVEVSVLVDRQGSALWPTTRARRYFEGLERDGIRVVTHDSPFNPMRPHTEHRKLFVIDDRIAYVGGMGFSGSSWHDVMVRLQGQQIVAQAHADFVGRWVDDGGKVSALQRRMLEEADAIGQWPVEVGYRLVANDGPVRDATRAAYALADSARERLWMQTPYFGSPGLADASRGAIARGADTRLWVNGDASAFPAFQQLSRSYHRDLGAGTPTGVRVFEQPRMSHQKVILTEHWASVGSMNLTHRALNVDHELNVISNDPRLRMQLEAMMRVDEGRARLVTSDDVESLPGRIVASDLVRPFLRRLLESMA